MAIMHTTEDDQHSGHPSATPHPVRPWISLGSTYDVEAWIDNYNRYLQQVIKKNNTHGYGICFFLHHGGEIFLHTTSDGDVLLDVTENAAWVAPVIALATDVNVPTTSFWTLPGDTLTQLILGLNSLIAATQIVLNHEFNIKKQYFRTNKSY